MGGGAEMRTRFSLGARRFPGHAGTAFWFGIYGGTKLRKMIFEVIVGRGK